MGIPTRHIDTCLGLFCQSWDDKALFHGCALVISMRYSVHRNNLEVLVGVRVRWWDSRMQFMRINW